MFQRYFYPAEYTNHDWVLVTSVVLVSLLTFGEFMTFIRHFIVCRRFTDLGQPRPEEACMHGIHVIFEGS